MSHSNVVSLPHTIYRYLSSSLSISTILTFLRNLHKEAGFRVLSNQKIRVSSSIHKKRMMEVTTTSCNEQDFVLEPPRQPCKPQGYPSFSHSHQQGTLLEIPCATDPSCAVLGMSVQIRATRPGRPEQLCIQGQTAASNATKCCIQQPSSETSF